jgi:signal transduction histidine kinase
VLAATAAAVALCVWTVAFTLTEAASDDRAEVAIVHGLKVAVPAGVALAVLRRRSRDRFAWLLLATAVLGSTTTLAVSDDSILYSIGRVMVWLVEPVLVYLLLAFPSGRLTTSPDRAVFRAAVLVDAVLYLPTVLFVRHFPEPSPWGDCGVDCPPNALAITDEPPFIGDIVQPLRELLTAVVFLAVAVTIARRMRRAAPLGRRALAPVLGTAVLRALALAIYDIGRREGPVSPVLEVLGSVYVLTLPLVALGFGAGLLAARLYVATALERLTHSLGGGPSSTELRAGLAEALEDPSMRVAYRCPKETGRWLDETGRQVPAPMPGPGRAITEVRGSGRVAAIDHDAALSLEPGILQAAATYALAVLDNARLVGELRRSVRDLSESRARIVSVGDEARRRIERDLHDGAQQRLVALRANLALESERVRGDSAQTAAALDKLGEDVEETIDEVRSIAHGIYPSLLADRGLGDALRAAALGAPIAAAVDVNGVGRYREEVETTVYFACVEAVQNAVKHARGATRVWISLSDDGRLVFAVRDDGAGFAEDAAWPGAGLTNMRDRVAAIGGEVTIESLPGVGTRVAGSIPARPDGAFRAADGERSTAP